jgi:hypothetical protein
MTGGSALSSWSMHWSLSVAVATLSPGAADPATPTLLPTTLPATCASPSPISTALSSIPAAPLNDMAVGAALAVNIGPSELPYVTAAPTPSTDGFSVANRLSAVIRSLKTQLACPPFFLIAS